MFRKLSNIKVLQNCSGKELEEIGGTKGPMEGIWNRHRIAVKERQC